MRNYRQPRRWSSQVLPPTRKGIVDSRLHDRSETPAQVRLVVALLGDTPVEARQLQEYTEDEEWGWPAKPSDQPRWSTVPERLRAGYSDFVPSM